MNHDTSAKPNNRHATGQATRRVLGLALLSITVLLFSSLLLTVCAQPAQADCLGDNALAKLGSQWLRQDCATPDWCYGADVNQSGQVNLADFSQGLGPIDDLMLVDAGSCRVSIHNVAVGTPALVEQYAAQQLQTAFAYATGLTPQINPATPAPIQIKLGLASRFATSVGNDHQQGYTVRRTLDNAIELVGNSSPAVLYAVTTFSRDVLGVMWPIADDQISRINPLQNTLAVGQLCITDQPDFIRRGWIIGDNADGFHYNDEICNWMSHTRQNTIYNPTSQLASVRDKKFTRGITPDTTMHSFWDIIPADEYWPQDGNGNDLVNDPQYHPEYFPLIDGVRVRPTSPSSIYLQLCVSNPTVYQIAVQKAVMAFYQYPEINVFGVCQNDGSGGWCQCDDCKALDGDQLNTGQYSNRLIYFVNKIADEIAPYYPGKKIGTYAYGETIDAPSVSVSENVQITFCTGGRNYMRPLTDPTDSRNAPMMAHLQDWLNAASHVSFWEYYYYSGLQRCPTPYTRTICTEFSQLYNLGLEGICSETYPKDWTGMSFFTYAFARLSWDTSLTYDNLLNDYCAERYGPAASAMASYHRMYEDTIYARVPEWTMSSGGEQVLPRVFTPAELTQLQSYLTTAQTLVAPTGTPTNINAVAAEQQLYDQFIALLVDPADIPGIGPNVVTNPGAESGSTYWGTDIRSGDYTFATPTGSAYAGQRSFQITCTGDTGWSRWYRTVTGLTPGKNYAVRFWVHTTGNSSGQVWVYGATPSLRLSYVDTAGQWVMVTGNEFTATSDSVNLYLNCFGPGVSRFDEIFIAELPE